MFQGFLVSRGITDKNREFSLFLLFPTQSETDIEDTAH